MLALVGLPKAVGLGLAVAAVTDVLDGRLARRMNLITSFGSKLDGFADVAINVSAVGWLLVLRPDVLEDHPFYFVVLSVVSVVTLISGWAKFGRLADFHLNSGRAAGVVAYLFLINLFAFDWYAAPLFYALMVLTGIVAIEAIMVIATRDSIDQGVPSPLAAWLFGAGRDRSRDRHPTP
jgi:CDP-diacylglycerol--glycerol-3-phosphate 3-phosphatidyltransferase